MMDDRARFVRGAGYAALATIPLLVASGLAFWLFLSGAGAAFGPINDMLVAICLVLLAWAIAGLWTVAGRRIGPWFTIVTALALIGAAVAALGQVLLVLGIIPLEGSFVTGSVGVVPILVWTLAVGVVAVRTGALPRRFGWASLAVLGAVVIGGAGSSLPAPGILAVAGILLAAIVGWLLTLGRTLLDASALSRPALSGAEPA
jgi:hypothetical protein